MKKNNRIIEEMHEQFFKEAEVIKALHIVELLNKISLINDKNHVEIVMFVREETSKEEHRTKYEDNLIKYKELIHDINEAYKSEQDNIFGNIIINTTTNDCDEISTYEEDNIFGSIFANIITNNIYEIRYNYYINTYCNKLVDDELYDYNEEQQNRIEELAAEIKKNNKKELQEYIRQVNEMLYIFRESYNKRKLCFIDEDGDLFISL